MIRSRLKAHVLALLGSEPDACAAGFDEAALQLWRWHIDAIPAYRVFCQSRVNIDDVRHWTQIPPLPTEAFRHAEIVCDAGQVPIVRRFTTSGTTKGSTPVVAPFDADALEILNAAVVAGARRTLFADGQRCRACVLAPPPDDARHLIMAFGMNAIMSAFQEPGGGFFAGPQGLRSPELVAALERACADRVPVCLMGASFAFVHLIDALQGRRLTLPEGSRALDAGGYKGRSRELTAAEFRRAVCDTFGLAETRVVNTLGMTELASQVYDDVERAPMDGSGGNRVKRGPPWVRTLVVCPSRRGAEVDVGEVGLLAHWDLANFARPLAILTGDLGRRCPDGFEFVGRVATGESRGCSLRFDLAAEAA